MAAEKQPNFAVSYKLDSRSIRTVTGFDTAAEATLWLRWSSTMDRAIRVVTVAQANKVSDKEGWNEYIQARRAEKPGRSRRPGRPGRRRSRLSRKHLWPPRSNARPCSGSRTGNGPSWRRSGHRSRRSLPTRYEATQQQEKGPPSMRGPSLRRLCPRIADRGIPSIPVTRELVVSRPPARVKHRGVESALHARRDAAMPCRLALAAVRRCRDRGAVPAGWACLAPGAHTAMRPWGWAPAPSVYPVTYPARVPAGILPRRCPVAGTWARSKIAMQACDLRLCGWT
jgi:hypothetical protein